jgi:tetratricopeptide (TPR) repeat protein
VVLKAKEGTLDEVPFAVLLHAIDSEERSCTLELKLRNLEKHVVFEDGELVGCESNLLHETLGKYLVEKQKLTEAQHHALLGESAASGRELSAVLVEQKLVSPFELFKHLQANLAHRILDAFRWQGAKWRVGPAREVEAPIRMNCGRLIHMGAALMPDEAVTRHFPLPATQRLAVKPDGPDARVELKLVGRELKLFQALKARPTVGELVATPGFAPGEVLRRLFAWCVLEVIDLAERVDAQPRPSPPQTVAQSSGPLPAPTLGLPFLDEDEQVLNALAAEYLSYRGKDPFDLLGVPVAAEAPALQKAFLSLAERFPPGRFRSSDSKAKAQLLLVAWAKALGALADAEGNALHRKRREVAAANKRSGGPKANTAAAHFRIQTELLDAESQFAEGLRRFDASEPAKAAEFFEYACDIEPKGKYRAFLSLARFRVSPGLGGPRALDELAEVCRDEPTCEEAWVFRADLANACGRKDESREAWAQAVKLNPSNPRYSKALAALK